MLSDFTGADKVFIACGYTDLRRGIDGLASIVQQQFSLDPFTNTLFLFCGRRRDRLKALYWENDGFILLYKRLEQGKYQWPRSEQEAKLLQIVEAFENGKRLNELPHVGTTNPFNLLVEVLDTDGDAPTLPDGGFPRRL